MRSIRNNKGFTLIELMIVVVIIGILAAVALPRFSNVSKNAKQSEAGPILRQICTLQGVQFEGTNTFASDIKDLQGWSTPNAKFFTFSTGISGTGASAKATATATPNKDGEAAKLVTQEMDCSTNVITDKQASTGTTP